MDLITPQLGLIFWQTITFLLVLFVLGKFVWKPILGAIKSREASIEEALGAAEKAKQDLENLHAENEKLIKEAKVERDNMLKEAQSTAAGILSEAREKATEEGQRIIEKARESLETEKKAAIADLKTQAANLSLEMAEMLMRRELKDKKAQEELLETYLKEAEIETA